MAQARTEASEGQGHFVAHLKIEEVVPRSRPSDGSTYRADPSDGKRAVVEVTQLVVKAPTLGELIVKVEAHIGVIGEHG